MVVGHFHINDAFMAHNCGRVMTRKREGQHGSVVLILIFFFPDPSWFRGDLYQACGTSPPPQFILIEHNNNREGPSFLAKSFSGGADLMCIHEKKPVLKKSLDFEGS